jgi:hypothetical protein
MRTHSTHQNLLSVDRCYDYWDCTVHLLAAKMIKGAIIVNNHGYVVRHRSRTPAGLASRMNERLLVNRYRYRYHYHSWTPTLDH